MFQIYQKELQKFRDKESDYVWDELEELITDAFEEGKMTSGEYDTLMRELMDLDCD